MQKQHTKRYTDWSKVEDSMLYEAAKKFQGNWEKISSFMKTKDASECFERA